MRNGSAERRRFARLTTLLMAVSTSVAAACSESRSLDGVWQVQAVRMAHRSWDTAKRSYVTLSDSIVTDGDSLWMKEGFVVLDQHGQILNSEKTFLSGAILALAGSDTVTSRLSRETGTAVLEATSKQKREGADSTCRGWFSMCTGDTSRIELRRVGDRNGVLPADRGYLEWQATLYSWHTNGMQSVSRDANEINLNWSIGESLSPTNADYTSRLVEQLLKLKQRFDSSSMSVHADTAALSYLRDVTTLLGGMHAIASEMHSLNSLFTPGYVNSNGPGLGGVLARMKAYLRSGTTDDSAVVARIPELLRRLSMLEERAELLRTREPQVQAFLSRKFGVPFPPIGAFEPASKSPASQ